MRDVSAPAPPLVVVTGASGFIALHCVARLLDAGYRVRGTLRDLARQDAVRRACGVVDGDGRLGFRRADLLADDGWAEALEGATYVLHVASPVPARAPADDREVIQPAVDGTMRVLRAAVGARTRRVVVTSSVAAVFSGVSRGAERVFTEADWSDLSGRMPAYSRSKTLAERAAWNYVAAQPDDRRPELVAVNPSYCLGPSLGDIGNASNELVRRLVDRSLPGVPRLMFPVVDVRDVADAHVRAMTSAAAAGERFIVSAGSHWYVDMAHVLAAEGFRVPTRVVPDWVVRVAGWFDPTVRLAVDHLGLECHLSSGKARHLLGWQSRSLRESLVDTARAMLSRRT